MVGATAEAISMGEATAFTRRISVARTTSAVDPHFSDRLRSEANATR
jgi:hypothetical protein